MRVFFRKKVVDRDDLYNSLITMVKWTKQFREENENLRSRYSRLAWSREFSTIKFCVPRQSGHTSFMKKILGQYGFSGSNSILFKYPVVIFPMHIIVSNFGFSPEWPWISTPSNTEKFSGILCDVVIVDCSSILSTIEINRIYNGLKHNDPIFLFLE